MSLTVYDGSFSNFNAVNQFLNDFPVQFLQVQILPDGSGPLVDIGDVLLGFPFPGYRQHGPKHSDCTSHYIRYDTLYAYVLSRLQYWSAQADVGVEHLKGQLLHANDREQQRMARTREAELKRAQKRQKELDRLFAKLYEDWAAERITEYNFNALSEKYQTEQAEVLAKIERLQAELASEQQATVGIDQWIGLIHQYAHPEELTAEMLNALVEKITVHEKTIGEDGEKEQTVDIYYRFVGKID